MAPATATTGASGAARSSQAALKRGSIASLPCGDAAGQFPVQAAAGFLVQLDTLPELATAPFRFPERYQNALGLVRKGLRTFPTTSMGRLFDTASALLGFTRE